MDTVRAMKKYELYSKFPDDKIRTYLNFKRKMFPSEPEIHHYLKNTRPLYQNLKAKLRDSFNAILKAKDVIYECLMQYDLHTKATLCHIKDNSKLLATILGQKYGDISLTYKDVFDFTTTTVEFTPTIEYFNPEARRGLMIYQGLLKGTEDEEIPDLTGSYEVTKIIQNT
jgi:hypothetical protein